MVFFQGKRQIESERSVMRLLFCLLVLLLSTGLGAAESLENVPDFNKVTAEAYKNGADWTKSPLQVALRLVGDRHASKERTISIKSLPETFRNAHITIIEEGLMDDSIRGIRFELKMYREAGYWVVESAKETFRCWSGRGADDYSDKPCL